MLVCHCVCVCARSLSFEDYTDREPAILVVLGFQECGSVPEQLLPHPLDKSGCEVPREMFLRGMADQRSNDIMFASIDSVLKDHGEWHLLADVAIGEPPCKLEKEPGCEKALEWYGTLRTLVFVRDGFEQQPVYSFVSPAGNKKSIENNWQCRW